MSMLFAEEKKTRVIFHDSIYILFRPPPFFFLFPETTEEKILGHTKSGRVRPIILFLFLLRGVVLHERAQTQQFLVLSFFFRWMWYWLANGGFKPPIGRFLGVCVSPVWGRGGLRDTRSIASRGFINRNANRHNLHVARYYKRRYVLMRIHIYIYIFLRKVIQNPRDSSLRYEWYCVTRQVIKRLRLLKNFHNRGLGTKWEPERAAPVEGVKKKKKKKSR